MQVLGGKLDKPLNRTLYDSFYDAFLSSFQVMITENWNNVLQSVYASNFSTWLGSIYLVSWVIIGNWILLNLFLAILLDEFTSDEAKRDQEEIEEELNNGSDDDGEQALYSRYSGMGISSSGVAGGSSSNVVSKSQNNTNKNSNNNSQLKLRSSTFYSTAGRVFDSDFDDLEEIGTKKVKAKNPYEGIECEDSLFFLEKNNIFRFFCVKIITHSKFETVILIAIVITSVKLAVETYFTGSNTSATEGFRYFDYVMNIFFCIEMVLKVISMGLILDKGSYLRDEWNMMDGFIVVTSIIDMSVPSVNIAFIRVIPLSVGTHR